MIDQLITKETAILAKSKNCNLQYRYFYTDENGLCEIEYDYDYSKLWIYDENLKIKNTLIDWGNEDEFWYNHEKEEFYIPEKYPTLTQSLLQRWLREVHKIDLVITISEFSRTYGFKLYYINNGTTECINERFSKFETYEEALEIGLQKALELI